MLAKTPKYYINFYVAILIDFISMFLRNCFSVISAKVNKFALLYKLATLALNTL